MLNINFNFLNKELDVMPIRTLFVEGESFADIINITMPKTYNNIDLSNKIFVIKMLNSKNAYYEAILPKVVNADSLSLSWDVTKEFTSEAGNLRVNLIAKDDAGFTLSSKEAVLEIQSSVDASGIPLSPEDVFEQYLQEMRLLEDLAIESSTQAVAAKTEALASKLAAEAARNIAVTAADDAVVRMQAFTSGTVAVQVETNKNEIKDLKNYLKIERYGVKISKANSSPTGAMEYLYDAIGKQPAYMDFATGNFNYGDWANAFFIKNNRPVMLNTDFSVAEELDKTDQTKKTDGTASSISNDATTLNAFAEFPQVWYKTYEDATHHYILISNVQYDDSYKCDVCIDDSGKLASKWYFPMFDGSLVGTKMRSLADKPVLVSKTGQQEIDYCKANGTNWYTLDKEQIHVFVMMAELISKNRNSQQAFGDQVSLATNTAGINTGSLKSSGQFKGYNDGIHATKMFFCETGSLGYFTRYAGHMTDSEGKQIFKNMPPYNTTGIGYLVTGIAKPGNGYVKEMVTTGDGIFAKTTDGSATTYWPDYQYFDVNCYARWRGYWAYGGLAGLRYVYLGSAVSYPSSILGSALSGRKPVI